MILRPWYCVLMWIPIVVVGIEFARPVMAQTPPAAEDSPYSHLTTPQLLELIRQELQGQPRPGTAGGEPTSPSTPSQVPSGVPGSRPASRESDESGQEMSTADRLKQYRLGPNDVIVVRVDRFPDFNFQGPITPEGTIVLPLINVIALDGLTLEEAQAKIHTALDRYIVNPQVSLSLISQRPVQVTVSGAVNRPGFYPLSNPRITDALTAAGGSLAKADLRNLEVRRTLADGTVLSQTLDLYTPLKTGQPLPSLRLEDGDVLMLPELKTLNDPDYDRHLISISTLAKPTISIRMLSYASNGIGTLTLPSGSFFRDALNGIPLDTANINSIALIRYDPQTHAASKIKVDGKKVLMGDPDANLALQDNDVIVVGRNLVTQISTLLNRFTQPFRDTLGFVLFFDSLRTTTNNLFKPTGK